MKKRFVLMLICCSVLGYVAGIAQQQDSLKKKEDMPKLEIPEITIIGKKAITLPFARKGEIYDVELFEAQQPDTSLLGHPPSMSLLKGSLPRYRYEDHPWRCSVEGMLGSFGTIGGRGYMNYTTQRWGVNGNAGFKKSNGHTTNADASAFGIGANAHTLVRTDNDVLKTFRASLGMSFEHNKYGLFGISNTSVRRNINDFEVTGKLGSLNRYGTIIDIDLAAKFSSLNDNNAGVDSSVSVVSPTLRTSFSTDVKNIKLKGGISYSSSSLDYSLPTQTPSLLDVVVSSQWKPVAMWSVEIGGRFSHGEDYNGGEHTLITPFGVGRLELDSTFAITFWFKPDMQFVSYTDYLTQIPYLVREAALQPERRPVVLGSSFYYNKGPFSLEVRGSFAKNSNTGIQIADSGRIRLEYAEATTTAFDVEGALQLTNISRLFFSSSITSAFEQGSSSQLPMVPTVRLNGRWETDFRIPVKGWSSVEYLSKRNVDCAGTQSLGDVFLVNIGASTSAIPKIILAAEVQNIFDVNYEWWQGYIAPGIQFNVSAKINLQ